MTEAAAALWIRDGAARGALHRLHPAVDPEEAMEAAARLDPDDWSGLVERLRS